ncbi:MAG: hypothetical protein IPQ04_02710 [Saprospiraceae bacterium]|nr:hypothetical protein [Saprospiraceae bacterium]
MILVKDREPVSDYIRIGSKYSTNKRVKAPRRRINTPESRAELKRFD